MKETTYTEKIKRSPLYWVLFYSALFWVVESFMDSAVFGMGPFIERLISPDINEMWMRIVTISILALFGHQMYRAVSRERKLTQEIMAMKQIATVGEMTAGIAHEINTPLSVLAGQAELLTVNLQKLDINNDSIKESLNVINRNSRNMCQIVHSIQALSGKGKAHPKEVCDLVEVLTGTISLCRPRFLNNNVELKISFPGYPVKTFCRGTEISQIVLNLLKNAFDAALQSEEKWVSLKLEILAQKIHIIVEDSGSGIPKEMSKNIFKPFMTTKAPKESLGIGLYLSYKMVTNHDGDLLFNPDDNPTKFCIALPYDSNLN